MKKLLTLLLGISIATTYAVVAPLSSPQVGRTPIGGYVLQTNGATSTWVATSSLGITGSSGGITFAYASSTFPSFSYASSTFASTSWVVSTFPTYTYTSSTYALLSSLASYMTFPYASSTFPSYTYASSTYYFASNPSNYITNSVSNLTNYPSYIYASSTFPTFSYASSTYGILSASNAWTGAVNSFSGLTFTNGSSTNTLNFLTASGTNLFATFATTSKLFSTNITNTNATTTNLTFTGITGSFLATDLTGKVIATTTPGGVTYTGTYPIIVTGSVISSGFSTSTNNVFSATTSLATTTFRSGLLDSVQSIGSSGQVLSSTGTSTLWITNAAGGVSGSGANGLVARWTALSTLSTGIFMDNGVVAGINATSALTDFTIKGTSGKNPFTISSSSNTTIFSVNQNGIINFATTTATTSPASGLNLYAQDIAGQTQLALKGKGVADRVLQNAWWNSDFVYFQGGTTGTVTAVSTWYNTIGTQAGTAARVLPTVTSNPYTAMKRITFANVITTQNQQVGTRSEPLFFRGSGGTTNNNIGGFFFIARVGFTAWTNNSDLFIGLSSCTTACLTGTTTLTNLANTVGFGVERLNQNLVFLTNDASGVISTTTISGAPALGANVMYDVYIYQSPNSPVLYWQIDNASTTAMIASGSVSSNLPATTTLMAAHAQIGNGGNTAATAVSLGVNRIYIETER